MLTRRNRVLPLLLCIGLAGFCGCFGGNSSATNSPSSSGTDPASSAAPAERPALFDGWETPAAVLILSANQHGYLEPCGCSLTQSGGVSRRADFERQIEERGWPVAGFDAGGTVRRSRRQSQIKFEAILASLGELDYRGLALGTPELQLGPDYLLSQHQPESPGGQPFLAANVVLYDSPDLGTPLPYTVTTLGDVTIAATSVLGSSQQAEIAPDGVESGVSMKPPAEVLPGVIEAMQQEQPDILLLMVHGTEEESRELAEKFPQFPIVLSSGGAEVPQTLPEQIGDSKLIMVGHKGKYVGVLGYFPDDVERPFRYELVDLDNTRFGDDPRMREHMRYYQDRLRDEHIAESPDLTIAHPSGFGYVGAAKCGECHTKAFAKWKDSKHAHAFESLSRGRKGQEENWISRIYDPECLACHVTGWHPQEVLRYQGGYVNEAETPQLLGQQCENCHGPGSRHTQDEEKWKADPDSVPWNDLVASRNTVKLTIETAKQTLCYQCHDVDNSPGFEFAKYWEKVKHQGRD